jgi:hypothetical protein
MSSSVEENRVRRRAQRQGYQVRKSKLRDHFLPHYGTVWLVASDTAVGRVDGVTEIGPFASFTEAENWLTTEPRKRATPAELEARLVPYVER